MSDTFTIVQISELTGKVNRMEFPSAHWWPINLWLTGGEYRPHIQTALPFLTGDQREFLLTGSTPDEWPPEDDDR